MADNPEERVRKDLPAAEKAAETGDSGAAYKEIVRSGDRHKQAEAAVKLRLFGANYSEIAEVLEYGSASLARQAVEAHLAATVSAEDREQARWMDAQRLLRVMRSLYDGATNPDRTENPDHLAYAKVYLTYVDRHIKLYGLDAPTEVNVTYNPSTAERNRALEELIQDMRGKFPEEADILDAEVVDEEEAS